MVGESRDSVWMVNREVRERGRREKLGFGSRVFHSYSSLFLSLSLYLFSLSCLILPIERGDCSESNPADDFFFRASKYNLYNEKFMMRSLVFKHLCSWDI